MSGSASSSSAPGGIARSSTPASQAARPGDRRPRRGHGGAEPAVDKRRDGADTGKTPHQDLSTRRSGSTPARSRPPSTRPPTPARSGPRSTRSCCGWFATTTRRSSSSTTAARPSGSPSASTRCITTRRGRATARPVRWTWSCRPPSTPETRRTATRRPPEIARAHHGSLSHEERALVEELLKSGELPCLVATSSLELGIDMGAVDLVIQVESPKSVTRGPPAGRPRRPHAGRGLEGPDLPQVPGRPARVRRGRPPDARRARSRRR